mmetsp:Transcript_26788/g.71709  ORF Transcript_26788/g.71709 Transcript_26788/m.71709 type:complete len:246 (+) Transcript_26788:1893-2630(+)
MSSRNNNFSNRAQKAHLKVLAAPTAPVEAPVNVQAVPLLSENKDVARMQLTWAEPGARSAFVGTDGREYWNVGQAASKPAAYRVQYTIDGGATWAPVENCQTTQTSCTGVCEGFTPRTCTHATRHMALVHVERRRVCCRARDNPAHPRQPHDTHCHPPRRVSVLRRRAQWISCHRARRWASGSIRATRRAGASRRRLCSPRRPTATRRPLRITQTRTRVQCLLRLLPMESWSPITHDCMLLAHEI